MFRYRIILFASLFFFSISAWAENESITISLDWFINPDHAPLLIAQEKGFFDEVNLDITLRVPSDPNDPPKLVAAGKTDLAISYQPQLYLHAAKGLPVTRIGTLVATPLNALIVLADGPITSIGDLKGRNIGYSVGGFEQIILQTMLAQENLTLDDVRLINVNFSLSPSLLSGQTDAVIGAFRNFELNQMDIEKRPGRAFYPEEHGVPAYDELIVIAQYKHRERPAFAAFLRALEKTVLFMVNHPEKSWALFIKNRPELDNDLNRRAFHDTLPRFALRPAALDRGRYQRFADFAESTGYVKNLPPLERYVYEVTP